MNFWNNKKILDLWVILHVTFGILIASVLNFAGVFPVYGLVTAFICALLWEIYERLDGINEYWANSLTDIFTTVIACYLTFQLLKYFNDISYLPILFLVFSGVVYATYFKMKKIH